MSQVSGYNGLLLDIQEHADEGSRLATLLPSTGQIHEVDLNTRTVNVPDFLSVQFDHNAEIIYFKCARYLDNMDLANTVCIIEFLNAEHESDENNPRSPKVRDSGLFWVPYYDVNHYDETFDENGNKIVTPVMYIPWSIGGLATKYPGKITFSIRFYKLSDDGDHFLYNMSTKPADSVILHGMDLIDDEDIEDFNLEPGVVAQIYASLSQSMIDATTYWIDL